MRFVDYQKKNSLIKIIYEKIKTNNDLKCLLKHQLIRYLLLVSHPDHKLSVRAENTRAQQSVSVKVSGFAPLVASPLSVLNLSSIILTKK